MKVDLSRRAFLKFCLASLAAGFVPGCRSRPPATPSPSPVYTPSPVPTLTPTVASVILPGTETWSLDSQHIDQTYQVSVNLPASYGEGDRFPTLYTTDSDRLFPLIRAIYDELRDENEIPELLIVGIGYPPEQAALIYDLRARDLTPFANKTTNPYQTQLTFKRGTGGGVQFLRFIKEQLKPAIDARYATLPQETAMFGHSFGGLFTLYTLFEEPGLFNRLVAASPSIWWANYAINQTEGTYAGSHTDLPARLFIGAGGDEGTEGADVENLADKLRQRGYPGLQVETQVFDGQGHNSMVPFCMSQGLREVFS